MTGILFDPADPAIIADPYPVYRRLRDEDPVHYSDHLGAWVLTRYDDVRAGLNDSRLSADRVTPYLDRLSPERRSEVATIGPMLQKWAVFMDPPPHTRLRRLLNNGFTSSSMEAFRPRVAAIVDRMADDLVARSADGEVVDFVGEFAWPLPATVIAVMLGIPEDDIALFRGWSEEIAPFVGSAAGTPGKLAMAESGAVAMEAYFGDLLAHRRRHPPSSDQETVIDHMMAAEERGDNLSPAELVANFALLMFAGHETTTNLLSNGLWALMQFPDQLRRLREDPELTAPAVEEFLRYDGPVGSVARSVLEDVSFGDKTIARGQRIFCMMNAANRDPRRFEDPDSLDVARTDNRHIIFGYGIHFCIGAPLARMEGQYAFPALLSRVQEIEPAAENPPWRDSFVLRGLAALPVRLTV